MIIKVKRLQGDESAVKVKQVEMKDPTFGDGNIQTARVVFQNPKASSLTYSAELYLGKQIGDKKATSGIKTFTVAAGGQQTVDFPVTMPLISSSQESYKVYVPVSVGGTLLVTYVATEEVVVVLQPAVNVIGITWS
jgi:hypothetical protein